MSHDQLYNDAIVLLRQLIAVPSLSKEEDGTADLIVQYFRRYKIAAKRQGNNVWAFNAHFNTTLPTILLNSHHDTVKPDPGYTIDPFTPIEKDGKLFGLGSNDAGGCLVSLIATFMHYYDEQDLNYNLVLATTAEEEISGKNGIESILPALGKVEFAIVGEPTLTNLAIAEKGLLVLDCTSEGKAGHAARNEGENAIYKAIEDINWFRQYEFPKVSDTLGKVKMNVTSIATQNKAHNMVPSVCDFVVDVRITDAYTHEEVLEIIQSNTTCTIKPRSMRLRASKIAIDHPVVQSGISLGRAVYGSPTLSDAALLTVPVLKCGPGNSARSHTADEFIFMQEIKDGIDFYISLLKNIIVKQHE